LYPVLDTSPDYGRVDADVRRAARRALIQSDNTLSLPDALQSWLGNAQHWLDRAFFIADQIRHQKCPLPEEVKELNELTASIFDDQQARTTNGTLRCDLDIALDSLQVTGCVFDTPPTNYNHNTHCDMHSHLHFPGDGAIWFIPNSHATFKKFRMATHGVKTATTIVPTTPNPTTTPVPATTTIPATTVPTTVVPATVAPTTPLSTTTAVSTTVAPTTLIPTTLAPTTMSQPTTTSVPTTTQSTTLELTTTPIQTTTTVPTTTVAPTTTSQLITLEPTTTTTTTVSTTAAPAQNTTEYGITALYYGTEAYKKPIRLTRIDVNNTALINQTLISTLPYLFKTRYNATGQTMNWLNFTASGGYTYDESRLNLYMGAVYGDQLTSVKLLCTFTYTGTAIDSYYISPNSNDLFYSRLGQQTLMPEIHWLPYNHGTKTCTQSGNRMIQDGFIDGVGDRILGLHYDFMSSKLLACYSKAFVVWDVSSGTALKNPFFLYNASTGEYLRGSFYKESSKELYFRSISTRGGDTYFVNKVFLDFSNPARFTNISVLNQTSIDPGIEIIGGN
jgi:hypothetical protein